ncbi:MAG: sortase [Candidatus Moraniibacteriota bacterium]|nr:MAG: sortase [Candidatus Moranbacteria bacterium]
MMDTLSPKRASLLERVGTWCIRVSLVFLLVLLAPVVWEESRYYVMQLLRTTADIPTLFSLDAPKTKVSELQSIDPPVDTDFRIRIPKINADSHVVADVDWQDSRVYQRALTKGVAHARGSALPGQTGNVFLFAHAGANPFEALRYNAVFYLIDKLEAEDRIDLWYQGKHWVYQVTNTKIVRADEVSYLNGDSTKPTLTLMTCWPAGTTWKRLIVLAEPVIAPQ